MDPILKLLIILFPIVSISIVGEYFPVQRLNYKPRFQPPDWVFGVVWTYVTLAFGYITSQAFSGNIPLEKQHYVLLMYFNILFLLNYWLVVNSKKEYKTGFYVLLGSLFLSVIYVVYLSSIFTEYKASGYKLVLGLLPLPFWLGIATSLNACIYDNYG